MLANTALIADDPELGDFNREGSMKIETGAVLLTAILLASGCHLTGDAARDHCATLAKQKLESGEISATRKPNVSVTCADNTDSLNCVTESSTNTGPIGADVFSLIDQCEEKGGHWPK